MLCIIDRMKGTDRQAGQAMVEFALVLPILMLILFGTIQFGTVFMQWQQLSSATSEGARKAAVSRSNVNRDAVVRTAVIDAAPILNSGNVTVNSVSAWTPGSKVTVTTEFKSTVEIPGWNGTLTSKRVTRVEQ